MFERELQPLVGLEGFQLIDRQGVGTGVDLVIPPGTSPALAEQLQLDHFAARLSPFDKARFIEDLQRSGRRVCAVGDGLGDALALQQALVSVSLAGAETAAQDSAQIVLLDSDLRRLPPLFELASRSRQNLDHLFLASALPTALALGGVCLAGFTQSTVQLLQLVSMVVSGALTARTVPEGKA